MIHLVHFWLKEDYKTAESLQKFEAALTEICQCDLATKSNWGKPAPVMPRPVLEDSWDYNLVTYFDTVAIHDEYQTCPAHVKFLEECKPMWEKVMVIDSELSE